jgi:hypothetical protein
MAEENLVDMNTGDIEPSVETGPKPKAPLTAFWKAARAVVSTPGKAKREQGYRKDPSQTISLDPLPRALLPELRRYVRYRTVPTSGRGIWKQWHYTTTYPP